MTGGYEIIGSATIYEIIGTYIRNGGLSPEGAFSAPNSFAAYPSASSPTAPAEDGGRSILKLDHNQSSAGSVRSLLCSTHGDESKGNRIACR